MPNSTTTRPGLGSVLPRKRAEVDGWENEGGQVLPIAATHPRKKLIVFDLDGTLSESKAPIDAEVASLLGNLLRVVQVAVISGGSWSQFQRQILLNLPRETNLKNLFLLPTSGAQFYQYDGAWQQVHADDLTDAEKTKIIEALNSVIDSSDFDAVRLWGDQIEDRGSQITFSALGQQAPTEAKERWDPDFAKRKKLETALSRLLPEFCIRLGGSTSVDVTRTGVDKGHGIRKLREILGILEGDMLFFGDALFPGGNDYAAKQAGVTAIQVRDPHETKWLVEALLGCLGCAPPSNPAERTRLPQDGHKRPPKSR